MWTVDTQPSDWPGVLDLTPVHVLDEYDGPRLFTVRSSDGYEFLAYQCAEDRERDRFLLTPARADLISDIEANRIALREALTAGWLWMTDRFRNGGVTPAMRVSVESLPANALPKPGVRLYPKPDILLRVRMIGPRLNSGGVPANVVKRTAEGAMSAVKTLAMQALDIGGGVGRPTENLRRYYDLPALSFSQNSFEIEFGYPDNLEHLELEENRTIELVTEMFQRGLSWAASDSPELPSTTSDWLAIVEAMSKLSPPQQGDVTRVEVSGDITGYQTSPAVLSRYSSQKISNARRQMAPTRRNLLTLTGLVREFDKDKLIFTLRDRQGNNVRQVVFSEDAYDDALLAFNSENAVTIIVTERPNFAELISIGPPVTSESSSIVSDKGASDSDE